MDINYELYKVFYYVATTLSFSEASKLLFISQSAVSQSIKVLEKKLGITLFIRSTKRVQLTPEGETLLRHVEPAINLIARGEAQIMEAGTLGGGQLRIGASDTICRYFLVPYLNRFHRSFPNVHIKVTNQTSTQCVDLLESGQVDFIVTNYPNSHLSSRLHTIPIHSFHDIFIANGEYYPELENRPVHLKELLQYPILMLDRKSTTSEFLHSQFQRFQLDLVPEIELGSNDLLIDLASIGLGIAFVPDYCLVKETAAFQLDLVEELPPRQLVVAHSSHLPIPHLKKSFITPKNSFSLFISSADPAGGKRVHEHAGKRRRITFSDLYVKRDRILKKFLWIPASFSVFMIRSGFTARCRLSAPVRMLPLFPGFLHPLLPFRLLLSDTL